jgi:hypothetical protein
MIAKTSLIVVGALLASAASAREGQITSPAIACKDSNIVRGFGTMMSTLDVPTFFSYVNDLKKSGQCRAVEDGQSVSFNYTGGGACLALTNGEPCFWTAMVPAVVEPETTGQASAR